jgi:signal transduction histidine kinase
MGQLTASLAHEVNQPIAAVIANAEACLNWLAADTPNIDEVRAAVTAVMQDARRAAGVVRRIRALFEKGAPQQELIDVNDVIRDMIELLRNDAKRSFISVRMDLTPNLPRIMGDRVQLQQLIMNLIMNSIDAVKDVEGTRELAILSQPADDKQLMVCVSDTGVGLPKEADQIFTAFFTTKPHGTGMGLSICRSIVESHSGRLWAAANSPRGARFHFTLPATAEPLKPADRSR